VRDEWLDSGVSAYLTASEYLAPHEQARGHAFDPSAWVDALLRLYPRGLYVEVLAALNRAASSVDPGPVLEYQRRFLQRLAPGLRAAVMSAVAGGVDGRSRRFLARQPVLRAMRLVLTAPAPQGEPDQRIAALLTSADHLMAAVTLVHLTADTLSQPRPEGAARFGGTTESLAIEIICNQIFNEPHDAGGMVSRTWALWTRHGAGLQRQKLAKSPLELLNEATDLELAELLAMGFACWAMTQADRVDGPIRINPFTLVKLPRETVERFLALFSSSLEGLASSLHASALPWQMLPLQTRPLLRVGDEEVVVLDEPFLLEAITTGLYWRVSDFVRSGDPKAWKPWSVAYAEMVEALGEELVEALAPKLVDGSSTFFTEESIKAAFKTKRVTPPNIDAGVDFGDSVVLFEIVNKPMSLEARSGNLTAFKDDVDQAVLIKAEQLDGTAALLRRTPQPPGSPLKKPATKVFPIVVCATHFPFNPLTRNYVEACLRAKGILQDAGIQPLAVIDLDELESCASLAKTVRPPELLARWLASPYAKGSLTLFLWATYGGHQLGRPNVIAASLREGLDAILPLLDIKPDGNVQE
jgi:hypothetical protein